MDKNRADPEVRIEKKFRLLKIGLYGFIASLVLTVFSLFSMGAASLLGLLWTGGRIIEYAGNIMVSVIPLFFAAPFLFFAILIASLLMKPQEVDMATRMKSSMGGIVIILAGGIVLCALPVLVAFVIVMTALYFRGNGIIFFAMAYFAAACLIFFLSGGYTLVREVAALNEAQTDIAWVKRTFRILRVGSADAGPEMDGKSHRTLTRIERIIGSLMGVVLFLLFKAQDLYETGRSVTGHGSDSGWLDVLATKETVLAMFSMFILIFSTLFIIKSVKTVFRIKGGVASTE